MTLRISNPKLIEELDRIVSEEKYESRNQLINEILELYVGTRSNFVCKALPSIVNSLCTEAMSQTTELSHKTLSEFVPLLEKISSEINYISAAIDISSFTSQDNS